MEITVKGKTLDVGDALKGHVERNLTAAVTRFFERALDATVVFSREAHTFRADITVHPGRNLLVQGKAADNDAYAAFDAALERIVKQLRRYKQRLRDHHKSGPRQQPLEAQYTILAPEPDEEQVVESPDGKPAIIAEMPHSIDMLTVGEAVMRMDLADTPVMMFLNSGHGRLNVVYRRTDGNIGWIDPVPSSGT